MDIKKFLKRIVFIVAVMCLVFPLNINLLTADDKDNGGDVSYLGHTFTWREAESWDRSYDTGSGSEWYIANSSSASNGQYTKNQIHYLTSGDYAEWDFTVNTTRTYNFWVRGWHGSGAPSNVRLYWDDIQIGDAQDWTNSGNWEWTNFGSKILSESNGTLKIMCLSTGKLLEVDNILITDSSTYTPTGKKTYGFTSNEIGNSLDYEYIEEITYDLSQVISVVDWDYLEKGRAFGTEGENYSKNYLYDEMKNEIDLYTFVDQITNIKSKFDERIPTVNLTDKLEVINFGVTVNDEVGSSSTNVIDACIQPSWNFRGSRVFGNKAPDVIEFLCNILGYDIDDDYKMNMIFNSSWLTKNISFENLKLRRRPTNAIDWLIDFFEDTDVINDMTSNQSIVDYASFMHYFLPKFQDYHEFTFGELNESNAPYKLKWFNDTWRAPPTLDGEDWVYFDEDPAFNPNKKTRFPALNELFGLFKDISKLMPWLPISTWLEIFDKGRNQVETLLWNLSMPHCKGLILYDFNDDTYDMNYCPLNALPTIYINGSIGEPMNESLGDYNVSFWLNQSWNQSVESYNVIGQINGTDPSKTIIIGCLYDSWWNQGTADSAIGMGMLLALAKYFKDFDITPKYNLKFIAYAGEEYGLRGAYHYESKYSDENIVTVIDLNQLGFEQLDPKLTLNIIINNESLRSAIDQIVDGANYVNRLNNTVDFRIVNTSDFTSPSDFTAFAENRSDCYTVCFLKDTNWTLHHRDGEGHSKGDVMDYYDPTDVVLTSEMILDVLTCFATQDFWSTSLYAGWNLITIPMQGLMASDLASNLSGESYVVKYMPDSQSYWWYVPGYPTFDFPLLPGHGYFVWTNTAETLSLIGLPIVDVNVSLKVGWNLIGWFAEENTTASSLCTSISGCALVVKYMPENQSYWWYIPGYPTFDFPISKGMGLFVETTENSTWYGDDNGDGEGGESNGGTEDNGSSPGLPYSIYGRAFYRNQSSPVENAYITIINLNTSGKFDTTMPANSSGYFNIDLGQLNPSGWDNGDIIRIFVNGTGNYSGWTGQKDITLNTSIPCENVPDIYLNPSNISLQTGWNLITIPFENDWMASDVCNNVTGSLSLSRWNTSNQTYRTYIVGGPPTFDFEIEDGYGYFIDVNQSSVLSWSGEPITTVNINYTTGWNLIGWYNDSSIMASSLAENITDCLSLSKWDAVEQEYWTYIVGGPPTFDFEITKGMGIFVDIDDGEDSGGSGPGLPHAIWGYASYMNSNIHANNANVTILNENTSEQIFTTVGELASGWYVEELGNLPSGWSDGHSIKVTINSTDTDIYEGWTGYKIITANDSVGNQKIEDIYLSGNCEVVRDDNGTKELTVTLDNSTDEALKTLEFDPEFLEEASSAKLWIYARADGEDLKNSSHKITVNNKSDCTILFDPIETFGYSHGWKSFDIPLGWLEPDATTFSVVDAYTSKQVNDLIIGIDTENDYDRSQWKESSGSLPPAEECEGELMMVLQFIF